MARASRTHFHNGSPLTKPRNSTSPPASAARAFKASPSGPVPRIAGTGPEGDALKALAAEAGGDVEFLGFVSGEPLLKWVREARAIVLPSEWYENAPMSVLEAYA